MSQRAKLFVCTQFEGAQTLDGAFRQMLGERGVMLQPNMYAALREAFFAGAAALDSMQCAIMAEHEQDTAATGGRLAALMDQVASEISDR